MHENLIARLRRQIGAVLALKQMLGWLAVWAFAWGTFVLVWRVALDEAPEWLWWGLAVAPLVAVAAAIVAMRRLPAAGALRALVDRSSYCGGLLMTAAEQPIGPWQKRLPEPAELRVNWRGGRSWGSFLLAVLFLSVSLLFPQRLASWTPDVALEIGPETEKLAAQIDVLKEEAVFDAQRAEFLKEKLTQLKDEASGKNPVKTLEALDHVRNMVTQAAKDAAESAVSKTEKLGKAEGLSEGLRQNDGALDAKVQKEAFEELAALVQKAAAETDLLEKLEELDPELLKELQAAKLTPEQMKQLAEALKGTKADLAKMLGKLHAAKLIDAEMLKKCEAAGQCECVGMPGVLTTRTDDATGTITMDDAGHRARTGSRLLVVWEAGGVKAGRYGVIAGAVSGALVPITSGKGDNLPAEGSAVEVWIMGGGGGRGSGGPQIAGAGAGIGGVTEGPGSAPIAWNHHTSEDGAKFKAETLPPAELSKLKESMLMKLGKADPKADKISESTGGALRHAARGGGAANTQVVLPRHKNAVERFFARPKTP
jgi:hypothetical protein